VPTPSNLLIEADMLKTRLRRLANRWECDIPDCNGMPHDGWLHNHCRASQREPEHYRTWALVTGRGFGKTRTGAETVKKWAFNGARHIAVIAKTDREVRSICFEGPAGLLEVFSDDDISVYSRSAGGTKIVLKNGCMITAFTAESPDNLRGYAFDGAWFDEFSSWPRQTAQATSDMVWFCLRESANPRVIVTTTPKPVDHLRQLLQRADKDNNIVVTRGSTKENLPNLSLAAVQELEAQYAGTRLGRQELEGELLEDTEGALWTWDMIEQARVEEPPNPEMITRIIVAVDPAITLSPNSDETGIVTACATKDDRYWVLNDSSLKTSPDAWARIAVNEYHRVEADAVIVEANQGGDAWQILMHQIDPNVNVRKVHAGVGKRLRAEPIASLYEQSRVNHVGTFPLLESQMVSWTPYDMYSPDRLDALVWALQELSQKKRAPTVVPYGMDQTSQWTIE
jgi:phage terminase large subunit-like protein